MIKYTSPDKPLVAPAKVIHITRPAAPRQPFVLSRFARLLIAGGLALLLVLNGYGLGALIVLGVWGIGERATYWYPDTDTENVHTVRVGRRIWRLYGNKEK